MSFPLRLRYHAGLCAAAGFALIGAGLFALLADLEEFNTIWYLPAWYGYLLLLDAAIHHAHGNSFLSHRRRETLAMLGWSIPFWLMYEAYNFRVRNWYYVYCPRTTGGQMAMLFLAYATVFPAIFFHAELLKARRWWRDWRWQPAHIDGPFYGFIAGLGALCLALPLLWPRQCFWMLWGAGLGVPEALNYKLGAPSLLGDLKRGRPARLLRLLMAGLLAGIVWESYNYGARCKWIYTVPGFEEWKIFEMPCAGFLGFPFLALEAFSTYSLICHVARGGRTWQKDDEQIAGPVAPRQRWLAITLGVLLTVFTADHMYLSIHSARPLLIELDAVRMQDEAALRGAGIPTPERLVRAVARDGEAAIVQRTGVPAEILQLAVWQARLSEHKGMGVDAAWLLMKAGIRDVTDLAEWRPEVLHAQLELLADYWCMPAPRLSEVNVWIRAARYAHGPRR